MNREVEDRVLGNILSHLDYMSVLARMTPAELVAEAAKSRASDFTVVQAMMDRLDPGWAERD